MQLVDANADVLFTDNENQSAKAAAINQQQTEVVAYLRVMGAFAQLYACLVCVSWLMLLCSKS